MAVEITAYSKAEMDTLLEGKAAALGADDNYVTDAEKLALHTHPAVIAQGATQADARAAIGAGTSSLVIGTTAGTVMAGDDSRVISLSSTYAALDHDHDGDYAPALGADDNYVTDAEKSALHSHANKTALDNVSGTNTGDQDLSGLLTTAAAPELIRDTMGSALVAGANVTITPDDDADTITIAAAGGTSTSQWAGKVIGNFGDSVTWYDGQYFLDTHVEEGTRCVGYQTYMRNELGCTTMNHGASGYTAPDVLSRIKSENIVNYDAITINAGSNDFWKSGALGVLAPRGGPFAATYYGALQEAIEYIRGVDPTIKIFLLTPIKGWHDVSGAMTDVWSQAMVDVGKMYSVPVLDWYHCTGIDDGTKSVYIGDKEAIGYDLHPTNAGYERMGRTIVSFLRDEGYAVSGSKADYVPVGTGAQLVASHTVTNGSLIDSSAITLDIATDTFTSAAHGLVDGTVVSIANHYPEGNCPVTSVSSGTPLFVINAATDTFQLSATSGGATLDWTSAGGTTAGHWSLAVGGDGGITFSGISGTRFRLKVRGNMRGAGACSPNITLNNASALGFVRPAPPAGHRTDQMFMDLDLWLDPDMDQWFASGRAGTWCRGPAGWISNVQNIITFSRRDRSWFNTNITSIAVGTNSTGNGGYAHGTIFEVWTA